MSKWNRLITVSDFLHAAVILGVLAVTAAGVSDELFDFSDVAIAARPTPSASVASGAQFAQAHRETDVK